MSLLLSLSAPLWAAGEEGMEAVRLQLLWKHQFQFAGYYVAKEKGYYAAEGMAVDIREFNNEVDLVGDALSGQSDFVIGRSSLLIDKANGAPIVALLAAFQQSPLMLLTRGTAEIADAKALDGKRIMVTTDAKQVGEILAMLLKSGIAAEDFVHQPHSFNLQDLIDGKTDAYGAYISNEPFQMQQRGLPYGVIHPRDYGYDIYSDILFTSEQYVQQNPMKTLAFTEASRRGWEYAFANIEETARLIFDKYNTQGRSLEALIFEGQALKELAYAGGVPFGSMSMERFQEMAQIYRIVGELERDFDISGIIYQPPKSIAGLDLNAEEQLYLAKNRRFQLCVNTSWLPYEGIADEQYSGLVSGYIDHLSTLLGIEFSLRSHPTFAQHLQALEQGRCDLVAAAMQTPERAKSIDFTSPYFSMPVAVATRGAIDDRDLFQQPLTILRGSAFEEILRRRLPDAQLIPVDSTEEGMTQVEQGKAVGYVSAAAHLNIELQHNPRNGFVISSPFNDNWDLSLGVYQNRLLADILSKAIDAMSVAEHQQIRTLWLPVPFEAEFDYRLLWQLSAVALLVLLFLGYRNRVISGYNRQLKVLASVDQLTGINNRYSLDTKLGDQIKIANRYDRNLSLIFFDIDDFKMINDHYGHQVGDQILQQVANKVASSLREADIFGRWGGEEFLVLLPEVSRDQALQGAEKIRASIAKTHFVQGIRLTCSFGVTSYQTGDSVIDFVSRADAGLYEAKRGDKNCVRAC
ncbi:diguanylate cyclase [Motiliproteus coralliicola]|uniref:diguanylate cyclase n=1 Tax=Motiliproteus coralliicola TaxID=2283196 RepID=UPI001401F8AA|nr:diguanylate cyclase [Motiliproteus coralliicola]